MPMRSLLTHRRVYRADLTYQPCPPCWVPTPPCCAPTVTARRSVITIDVDVGGGANVVSTASTAVGASARAPARTRAPIAIHKITTVADEPEAEEVVVGSVGEEGHGIG